MGLLESIDIDVLEMGETPMRMGGIKVQQTTTRDRPTRRTLHSPRWAPCHPCVGSVKSSRNVGIASGGRAAAQVYESREDNLITEGVLIYGSGMRLRVVARVRIPNIGYAISIPIEVSNIQVQRAACCARTSAAAHSDIMTHHKAKYIQYRGCSWATLSWRCSATAMNLLQGPLRWYCRVC